MRYQSKPSEIEAVRWDGWDRDGIEEFAPEHVIRFEDAWCGDQDVTELYLLAGKDGAQGWVPVPRGHWIVRQPGDLTDHWPVDEAYFAAKYEAVPQRPWEDA